MERILTIIKKIKWALKLLDPINFIDHTSRLKQSDVLLFCHDVNRGISLNGKAYAQLLDSVRDDLEARGLICQTIAFPWAVFVGRKSYGDAISINRPYLKSILIRGVSVKLHKFILPSTQNVYENILIRTNAKLIITIGSPDDLCTAARSYGAFHVELLHGIGYAFLPWDWDKKDRMNLPKGVLSLDEISTQSFSPLEKHGIQVRTIPNPFVKRFINSDKFEVPKEWIMTYENNTKYRKQILVSLQWGYAGDSSAFANILNNGLFYDELAEVVAENKDILWRFRFHPVQLRQRKYNHLRKFMDDFVSKNSNCEWIESSSLPLPSVVMQCDGNISMTSMTCYEAAVFGVSSLMLCPTILPGSIYEDYFSDLVAEGYVTKAAVSREQLRTWVQVVEKMKPRHSNLYDEDAWEDAVSWMLMKSGLDLNIKPQANAQ
jgi:hypothetical protein